MQGHAHGDSRHGTAATSQWCRSQNTSSATLKGWKVEWSFAGNEKVKGAWNAKVKQHGAAVTATNTKWNGTVKPGKSVYFGYIGKGVPAGVTEFTVNGVACQ